MTQMKKILKQSIGQTIKNNSYEKKAQEKNTDYFSLTDKIHILAGTLVLVFATLTLIVHVWFIVGIFFVGANLLQFGFTKFCPAAWLLKKI